MQHSEGLEHFVLYILIHATWQYFRKSWNLHVLEGTYSIPFQWPKLIASPFHWRAPIFSHPWFHPNCNRPCNEVTWEPRKPNLRISQKKEVVKPKRRPFWDDGMWPFQRLSDFQLGVIKRSVTLKSPLSIQVLFLPWSLTVRRPLKVTETK